MAPRVENEIPQYGQPLLYSTVDDGYEREDGASTVQSFTGDPSDQLRAYRQIVPRDEQSAKPSPA
jgi:hypothetical protein